MADPHDHSVALCFYLGPQLGIVLKVSPDLRPDDKSCLRISFGQQFLHFRKKLMGVGKSYVDDIDCLPVEIVETRGHGNARDGGRLSHGIEHCYLILLRLGQAE
jgi:hypothetical protein